MVVHIEFLHGNVIDRDTVKLLLLLLTKTINVNRPCLLLIILINANILVEIRLLCIGETVGAWCLVSVLIWPKSVVYSDWLMRAAEPMICLYVSLHVTQYAVNGGLAKYC